MINLSTTSGSSSSSWQLMEGTTLGIMRFRAMLTVPMEQAEDFLKTLLALVGRAHSR